ncbi:MAG TPA: hypothetical protein VEQ63_09670 [Bryobacteraceae bacterium]|nr:hypothetical protein [Bryobacteraceae bacterium]
MIAPSLSLNSPENADRQSQEARRLLAVLVVTLAFVTVSTTVLMVGSWASMSTGMLELEESVRDRQTEIFN